MSLAGLLDAVLADPSLAHAVAAAGAPQHDLSAPPPLYPFAIAALAAAADRGGAGRPVLAVTATGRAAEDLAAALACLLPPDSVALYPSWETLPHEKLSPRADTVGRRLAVLRRLAHPSADDPATGPVRVVVAPVRSVLQPQAPGLGDLLPVVLSAGTEADLAEVVTRLAGIAYARVDLVEKRGEFAVRGGILDVFPPTDEHPVRVEFFGDTVEEVRYFKVADQRSLEIAPHGLWAAPCRELLLTDEVRMRAAELAKDQQAAGRADLAEMLDRIADGIPVEGMEALSPVLVDGMRPMLHDLPPGTHVLVCDPERVRSRAADLVRTSAEFLAASWAAAATGGVAPVDLGAATLRDLADIRQLAGELALPWWSVTPFTDPDGAAVGVGAVAAPAYRGDIERVVTDLAAWQHGGWRVALLYDGHGPATRAAEMLRAADVAVRLVAHVDAVPPESVVTISTGQLASGFVAEALKLAVLTEADLTGSRGQSTKDMGRMPSRRRAQVDPLQLAPGDLVVHEQHGVGRYVEMVRRTVNGGEREYLILEYAAARKGQPADRLYVPTDALDQVTRYVGGESPALNRLGGADWAKTKGRARKAVKEIAGALIRLYAARTSAAGHAFEADTPWQRELEDAFPYVETVDQLAAINEVKADMERTVPMDRVVCGDVGYGKTEIAVRAAFKAVQGGKQVAVLVPTTLLAQQHFATFSERMAQFPVNLRQLSRFVSDVEAEQTLAGLADGTVDIVIGTHRLVQSGVRFKELGLVVVDEEQRFGVEHKEHLKQLRAHVDVLTMSATPIPRTLEMSLTGIREMSTILTPPEERHPVLTFVGPYDDPQIAAAIRRELLREGQVFFVHNRVDSIDRAASRLAALVPEARVATAHGQMGEHLLERVIVDFWEKRSDVLVCTTIVETGLDISNANTLIVERADLLGLSQLHQLRGRVGRARERAYAYFLYPPEKPLTETAHDRLATVAQHSDLGAGMYVAMKDLEIRGAGNLLGGEQSGHIAGVGFDLYVRMVGEAVAEYRGDAAEEEPAEVKVDLPVNAHLPHDYVTSDRLRLEAYKRLAAADTAEAVQAVAEELRDRYGAPPEPVANLLAVARFRVLARSRGITDVSLQGSVVRMSPVSLRESAELRMQRLYPRSVYKSASQTISLPRPGKPGQPARDLALLTWCADVLTAVLGVLEPA
ncbi:MAG: transcription-repair coupling factor [Actinobacteria bacterium]|nr:transcription-repair coupling factor [Actinomycetota bacterium]MBI3686612.1 transcription-repair coupling factor [Actinomycetota bacterium]